VFGAPGFISGKGIVKTADPSGRLPSGIPSKRNKVVIITILLQ
jgi:hypothetical protein